MGRRAVSLLRLMSMALPRVNLSGERKPLSWPRPLAEPFPPLRLLPETPGEANAS